MEQHINNWSIRNTCLFLCFPRIGVLLCSELRDSCIFFIRVSLHVLQQFHGSPVNRWVHSEMDFAVLLLGSSTWLRHMMRFTVLCCKCRCSTGDGDPCV